MKFEFILTLLFISTISSAEVFQRKIHEIFNEDFSHKKMQWRFLSSTEEKSVKRLISILSKSETGMKVLSKSKAVASMRGMTLNDVIIPGSSSLTDTTLIRKFSSKSPENVVYESRSKVYLNRELTVMNAVLDLAHELTHFSMRRPFNPYVGHFDLTSFVSSTIEGEGGEVDAYIVECRVYDEIYRKKYGSKPNCERVKNKRGELSRPFTASEFYKVGNFKEDAKSIAEEFSLTGQYDKAFNYDQAVFISSAYGMPYPLAAIREYMSIMKKACLNDQNRLRYAEHALERSPASYDAYQSMQKQYLNRCRDILN